MGQDDEDSPFVPQPVRQKSLNKDEIIKIIHEEVNAYLADSKLFTKSLNKAFEQYNKDDSQLTSYETSVNFAEKRFSQKNKQASKSDLETIQAKQQKMLNDLKEENQKLRQQLEEMRNELDKKTRLARERKNCTIM